jgi:hypothetical protein
MSNSASLVGIQFGRLKVTKKLDSRNYHMHWLCECKCGNTTEVSTGNLKSRHTLSCGCLQKDHAAISKTKHGLYFDEHGKRTKLYRVWGGMKERCFDFSNKAFSDYGGRGIKVCSEWLDYETFHAWAMAKGYKEGVSIERINNDGNYEPSNCKWIESSKQASNRRNNHYLTFNGQTKTITVWANELGIYPKNLLNRITRGWSVERALTTPDNTRRKI